MGGNLAFRVAYERPQIFKALITSVPMFGVKALRYIPACMVKAVHKFMPEHYVPGGVDWNEMQHLPPKLSILTKDKVRNPIEKIWLNHDANLRIGAITYGWLYEAWQSCQAVFALDVSQFDMPCLIFEAQHEHLVDNKAIDKMTARLPNVEKVFLKGSYHEPFLERDYIRDIMLNKMKEFITRYLPV